MLAKGRRHRPLKARASHAAQVQSRVKKLEKIDRVEPPRRRQVIEFDFARPPRSGDDVAKLEHVDKGWGPKRIYRGFDFLIRRRARWCVMGVNGAGKSTLLKLIAGEASPDAGAVTLGASVRIGYFAQHSMEILDPQRTVPTLEVTHPNASIGSLRALAGAFGFAGDDVDKRCRVLSGGERSRLVLAQMLYQPPNFLVLDEPTNHLDLATKEMLTKALADFDGTMIFVSHDRSARARFRTASSRSRRGRTTAVRRRLSEYVVERDTRPRRALMTLRAGATAWRHPGPPQQLEMTDSPTTTAQPITLNQRSDGWRQRNKTRDGLRDQSTPPRQDRRGGHAFTKNAHHEQPEERAVEI